LAGKLERREGGWLFHPPSWRLDLAILQDVAEEVARHIGYDSIPGESGPVRLSRPCEPPVVSAVRGARSALAAMGFSEIVNTDFLSEPELDWSGGSREGAVALANPIAADQAFLRTGLVPGLLRAASYNASRGRGDLRLFEVGRRYAWDAGRAVPVSGRGTAPLPGPPDGAVEERRDLRAEPALPASPPVL
ncbi:MAG: hypothetical protein AAB339_05825, partial [Elusimicrobiota bacterium]